MYYRLHHFVVKFSKFSLLQAARGIDPPNQNPADVFGVDLGFELKVLAQDLV